MTGRAEDLVRAHIEGPLPEGWGRPANARKWHYFVGVASLCGRWLYVGDLHPGVAKAGDCVTCLRKLAKREQDQERAQ